MIFEVLWWEEDFGGGAEFWAPQGCGSMPRLSPCGRVPRCTEGKPRRSWLVTHRESPGSSSWHSEFSYHTWLVVPVENLSVLTSEASRQPFPQVLPSLLRTDRQGIWTTKQPSLRNEEPENCHRKHSPITQSWATQLPELEGKLRRCSCLHRHWWISCLLQMLYLNSAQTTALQSY